MALRGGAGMRWILAATAWLLLSGPAFAWNYVNTVTKAAASAASTIEYFADAADGLTTTRASGRIVNGISIHNTATVAVTIRIYSKQAPIFIEPFSATFATDFGSYVLQPGETLTLDEGLVIYGIHLATTPTGGPVTFVAWGNTGGAP